MTHHAKSVAPDEHPVCTSCADLPLSGPSPQTPAGIPVHVGPAALVSVPCLVRRYPHADIEGCCWCGVETDQAYYAFLGPKLCAPVLVRFRPRPGFFRKLWRRAARSVDARLTLLRWLAGR